MQPRLYRFIDDFRSARRKAALEEITARISGKQNRLLKYDDVRTQLQGLESAKRVLKDIPLDSIVGTVGRYNDFTRKLLPLHNYDLYRWAKVRQAVESAEGLPPIEVYQIGSAYFILDGHHRASIAREMGSTHIQAYVREVNTPLPISPQDQPEDILLKAEYIDFLQKSKADQYLPGVDLSVTSIGAISKLYEHIEVHHYFMGLDLRRPVSFEEGIKHWYTTIYLPVIAIIRRRKLLRDFPNRTEADLYLWIMDHRQQLESVSGSKVSIRYAAEDIRNKIHAEIPPALRKVFPENEPVTSDQSEPPPESKLAVTEMPEVGLFETMLVSVTGDTSGWTAVEYAARVAHDEGAHLTGIHVMTDNARRESTLEENIRSTFDQICRSYAVKHSFEIERGDVTDIINNRAKWNDLLVLRLAYPPPLSFLRRFGSGLRYLLRNLSSPVLAVPPGSRISYHKILLAYGAGSKADQALYIAAYISQRWSTELTVLTAKREQVDPTELSEKAREYLDSHGISANYVVNTTNLPAEAIFQEDLSGMYDLILLGGYESGYLKELFLGSTVDRVLHKTRCPVMACT